MTFENIMQYNEQLNICSQIFENILRNLVSYMVISFDRACFLAWQVGYTQSNSSLINFHDSTEKDERIFYTFMQSVDCTKNSTCKKVISTLLGLIFINIQTGLQVRIESFALCSTSDRVVATGNFSHRPQSSPIIAFLRKWGFIVMPLVPTDILQCR